MQCTRNSLFICVLRAVYANGLLAASNMLELDGTVNESKQGVILADADIVAGMYSSTSLADDYVTCLYSLTVGLLNAKTLCFAVAAVLCGADALLMSEKL